MSKFYQINTPIGTRFGELTTLQSPFRHDGVTLVVCGCSCGSVVVCRTTELYRKGRTSTKTCGLHARATLRYEIYDGTRRIGTQSPEYVTWNNIKVRCRRTVGARASDYGGRGIKVCQRWLNSFEDFYADMGPRPSSKHSIERMDNNGDYSPENCVWATGTQQARNKRNVRLFFFQGQSLTIAGWAEAVNLKANTIHGRLKRGWTIERTLTTPLMPPTFRGVWHNIDDLVK